MKLIHKHYNVIAIFFEFTSIRIFKFHHYMETNFYSIFQEFQLYKTKIIFADIRFCI